jgi:uncharacterized protein (UPF0332 family)
MLIEKARESLKAAELCFGEGLYNSSVSRAYYAMFQAAIVSLERVGILPLGKQWSHEGVQATFALELTTRRKFYSRQWNSRLMEAFKTRNEADYKQIMISGRRSGLILNQARDFLLEVERVISYERRT